MNKWRTNKCCYCGRIFETHRGLRIHQTKKHGPIEKRTYLWLAMIDKALHPEKYSHSWEV